MFDPVSNTFLNDAFQTAFGGNTDEQSWVKLPDQSIITFNSAFMSERFIPSDQSANGIPTPMFTCKASRCNSTIPLSAR